MRKLLAVAAIGFIASCWLPGAGAETKTTNDTLHDDHVLNSDGVGNGHLDIASVKHSDDGTNVSYVVTMREPFTNADVDQITVQLDDLEGMAHYDCLQVAVPAQPSEGALKAHVLHCMGSGGGEEGGPGGTHDLGAATVSHEDGSHVITIAFPIADLRKDGFSGSVIHYSILALSTANTQDTVPDDASHPIEQHLSTTTSPDLPRTDGEPTPTPHVEPSHEPASTPHVEPTPHATEPHHEPTPSPMPHVEPTHAPDPTHSGDVSFAAPAEHADDSHHASGPLKAAAAGTAGLGIVVAILKFKPF